MKRILARYYIVRSNNRVVAPGGYGPPGRANAQIFVSRAAAKAAAKEARKQWIEIFRIVRITVS